MNSNRIYYTPMLVTLFSGFAATSLQIILIQESLAQNNDNELSVSIFLGIWLILTGLGSFIGHRLSLHRKQLMILPFVMACLLPLTLIGYRIFPAFLDRTPGELPRLLDFFLSPSLILIPFCILNGLLFALPVRFIRAAGGNHRKAAAIYATEAFGALTSAVCIRSIHFASASTLHLAGFILAMLIPLFLFVYLLLQNPGQRKSVLLTAAIFVLICLSLSFLFTGKTLSKKLDTFAWPGQSLVSVFDTLYGRWHLVKYEDTLTLFNNFQLASQQSISQIDEETICYALALHPNPTKILLLEGLLNKMETITDQLEHVEVDIVTLDTGPLSIMEQNHLIGIGYTPETKSRKLFQNDPRRYLAAQPENTYDIVISNAGAPGSLSASRFYSEEFFKEIRKVLRPDGIFAMTLAGSENVLSDEQGRYINIILNSIDKSFSRDSMLILSGDVIHIFAGIHNPLTIDSNDILKRIETMNLQPFYSIEGYLPYRMNPLKSQSFIDALSDVDTKEFSTDTKPIVFPAFLDLWHSQWRPDTFKPFHLKGQTIIIITILCFFVVILTHALFRNRLHQISFAVFLTGSVTMITQVLLIFLIQLRTGALYREAGILLGIFALGLALGSSLFSLLKSQHKLFLPTVQTCLAALLCLLGVISSTLGTPSVLFILVFAFLSGLLGSAQFVLASRVHPDSMPLFYSMDLIGGAVAAIFVSTLFLPTAGIPQTALLFGSLLFISGVFLFLTLRNQ